jgi:cell division protein FtsB
MAATASSSRRAAQRRPAPVIRWDRLGRIALLLVLFGVVALYVKPVYSYWSTLGESKTRAAEVQQLERENATLRARRDALKDPIALEREARKLGMVRPGERAYVVEGLPGGDGR